tara:strand:+ start:108 stop:320 length:213 start_codon:yes stop_codon:yes gene_type:complete
MIEKDKELCERVHSFLLGHKKNPFYVLSTEEFGLLRGGYYLVKKISMEGQGLRIFKKTYADYLLQKYSKQ